MLTRLGNVLYWYGIMVAVLTIVGAVVWNGVTVVEAQQVQKGLETRNAAFKTAKSTLEGRLERLEAAAALGLLEEGEEEELRQYSLAERAQAELNRTKRTGDKYSIAQHQALVNANGRLLAVAKERRATSLLFGGVLVLFGLGAYGVGWAARYILRAPS